MPDSNTCTIPVGFVAIPMDEYVNMKDGSNAVRTSLLEELAKKNAIIVERDAEILDLKEEIKGVRKELQSESYRLFEALERLRCCDANRHALLDDLDEETKRVSRIHKLLDRTLLEVAATRNKIKELDPEAYEEWMANIPDLWDALAKAVPFDEDGDPDEDDDAGKEAEDAAPEEET